MGCWVYKIGTPDPKEGGRVSEWDILQLPQLGPQCLLAFNGGFNRICNWSDTRYWFMNKINLGKQLHKIINIHIIDLISHCLNLRAFNEWITSIIHKSSNTIPIYFLNIFPSLLYQFHFFLYHSSFIFLPLF